MVPVNFCRLPKGPLTQDTAEPIGKGGHAFVILYLRKKGTLERGKRKWIRGKQCGNTKFMMIRTCSTSGQACPSKNSSLWRTFQKKIFPYRNVVYGWVHIKTVTPSKGLHPVEKEWERRSSREKLIPHLTMPDVSLKRFSPKYTSWKVKEEPGLKSSLGKTKERCFHKHVLVSFSVFLS